MQTESLTGQVAIVTGGASGIGYATCLELLRAGAHVVMVDIDTRRLEDSLSALQHALGPCEPSATSMGLALDVRREEDMNEMARQTLTRFGRIDILLASAGILRGRGSSLKPLVELSAAEWDEVIDTNLKGVFLSNRAVLSAMIEQRRGQIINVSSTSGRQGRAFDSAYCASKSGVIGFSESVAQEVGRYGVKVHVVLPDAVDTPLWDQNGPVPPPEERLSPARVANVLLYLLTLPGDTMLLEPVIAPFRPRRRASPSRRLGARAE